MFIQTPKQQGPISNIEQHLGVPWQPVQKQIFRHNLQVVILSRDDGAGDLCVLPATYGQLRLGFSPVAFCRLRLVKKLINDLKL